MPRKLILAKERGGLGPAPVIFFPRSIERHALRRALGQVHSRHIATVDQEVGKRTAGQLVAALEHGGRVAASLAWAKTS